MHPIGHCNNAALPSVIKTTSPSFKSLISSLHFSLSCKDVTYSLLKCFRKCKSTYWMSTHLVAAVQPVIPAFFGVFIVEKLLSFVPQISCAGINSSPSFRFTEITPIGHEFKIFLTWQHRVVNSSKLKTWFPSVRPKLMFFFAIKVLARTPTVDKF